jgi:hypothetical protein
MIPPLQEGVGEEERRFSIPTGSGQAPDAEEEHRGHGEEKNTGPSVLLKTS